MSNVVTILVKAEDQASSVLDRVKGSGNKLALALSAGVASAATAAGAAVLTSVKSYVELGDSLDEMSARTGFSTEALSELSHAATLSGTSIDGLEVGIRKMQSTVYDAARGSDAAAEALGALGLAVEDLQGLSAEEQFNKITAALADVEDQTTKSALAVDIFGRSGTALLPMLDGGAESLAKMRAEAHSLGVVMSEEDAKAAAEFADLVDNAKAALQGAMLSIARVAVPVLNELADWLGPRIQAAVELAKIAFTALSDWAGEQWARFRPYYEEEIAPTMQAIIDSVQTVIAFVSENWPLIEAVIKPTIENVRLIIETALAVIGKAFTITLRVIRGDWQGAWESILSIVQTVGDAVVEVVQNMLRQIEQLFVKLRDLKGMAGTIARAALGPVGAAADLVGSLEVPGFATGGIVPGPIGAPTLAVVHGGEQVLTPQQQAWDRRSAQQAADNGATITINNLTVNAGMGADGAEIADTLVSMLNRAIRRDGAIFLPGAVMS